MKQPTQRKLLAHLERIEKELWEFRRMIRALVPEKEWYTTQEFASLTGIKAKTVTNYCGKGQITNTKKNARGQYLIHKSELKNFLPVE